MLTQKIVITEWFSLMAAAMLTLLIPFVIFAFTSRVLAGSASNSSSQNTPPPTPYTNGAPVAKVLYATDGSTITITSTGAVIKQSPGGNAYREGWVNPNNINDINSMADLNGMVMSGSSNPYTITSGQRDYPPAKNHSNNYPPPAPAAASNSTSSATAYSSSSASVPAAVKSDSYNKTSDTTQPSNELPNTGTSSAFALGGLAVVFGTLSHFIYQRLRYR